MNSKHYLFLDYRAWNEYAYLCSKNMETKGLHFFVLFIILT